MAKRSGRSVTLSVSSGEAFAARLKRAFGGRAEGEHISFATPELLWSTLTSTRWDLLKAMTGSGSIAIRDLARRVGRDVEAVRADVAVLLHAGIVEPAGDGVAFPYDRVHVDFVLEAA